MTARTLRGGHFSRHPYRRILNRHTAAGSFIKLPKRLPLRCFTSLHRLFEPGAMGSMELPVILL
jgi:hypothetical protein